MREGTQDSDCIVALKLFIVCPTVILNVRRYRLVLKFGLKIKLWVIKLNVKTNEVSCKILVNAIFNHAMKSNNGTYNILNIPYIFSACAVDICRLWVFSSKTRQRSLP